MIYDSFNMLNRVPQTLLIFGNLTSFNFLRDVFDQGFCNTFICDPEDTFSVASFKENFDIKLALASSHATITFDLE